MISDLQKRFASLVIAALFVVAASACSSSQSSSSQTTSSQDSSSQSNPQCADTTENSKAVMAQLAAAKQSVNDGRNAQAKQQAQAVEKLASTCIDAGQNTDVFHYMHAFAAMIEAQARMASGDVNGLTIFQNATDEVQTIADNDSSNPDLQKMAKDLVSMAHVEMKQIQAAKKGDLIEPPPTPTP